MFSIFCFLAQNTAMGQSFPISYDFMTYNRIGDSLYSQNHKLHSSIKPYLLTDSTIQNAFDTALSLKYKADNRNFFLRKIFNEHLVEYSEDDYSFYFDFYPDFQVGKEFGINRSLYVTTRGFQLGGKIGKQFYFQSNYFTDQAKFPIYLTKFIDSNYVVPGQGFIKFYGKDGFDFSHAEALVNFTPNKHFSFELGSGKTFIGDGYRSLLLSDASFSYPYFKIITTVGPFRYMNLWTQMSENHGINYYNDSIVFPKKYGYFQYLDWSIGKKLNFGFFQNVMFKPRGLELNYINPIIFIVPVQFSIGSPDKVTIGFNTSYKFNNYVLYGQFVLSDFTISHFLSNKGYFDNKQGFQLGFKSFNLLGVKKLFYLLEFNNVRPYTYLSNDIIKNYAQYSQPLADPFGAGFKELVSIVNYSKKRFDFKAEFIYCFHGQEDPSQPTISYGNNLYKDYASRPYDRGLYIGSGVKTNFWYSDVKASYMLNYKNNLKLEAGFMNRKEFSAIQKDETHYFTIGLKGSFRNIYYDF